MRVLRKLMGTRKNPSDEETVYVVLYHLYNSPLPFLSSTTLYQVKMGLRNWLGNN